MALTAAAATVIMLAVPGLASTAGAATMRGSSLSAVRSVSSVNATGEAILAGGEKAISVRVPCGNADCGFNGNVEWGTNYLKIWGIVWGTKDSGAYVLLTWYAQGVSWTREPGSAPGEAGVGLNHYYPTSEPSYIQVQVCGRPGDCSAPEDP